MLRMEWNGRFEKWNEMEDLKNGMEDRLPYFHISYVYAVLKLRKDAIPLENNTIPT